MTADYCTWFLQHFRNYNYYGDEAQNVKRRLGRVAERLTPPTEAEIVELYSQFYRLYNADVFSDKSSAYPGIRPKTGDYFLIFTVEKTPVPMAYLAEKTVISENDIRDAVAAERERKLKYLQDVTEYQIKRRASVRALLDEARGTFSTSGSGLTVGTFVVLAVVMFIAGCMFFAQNIREFYGFSKIMGHVFRGICGVSVVLFVLLAFFGNKKYSYYTNSRNILDHMLELQERIDDNVVKIKQCKTQGIRLAIRNGKKIKPLFMDTDYGIQLRYFETSVELLKLRLENPTTRASVLYFLAACCTNYVVSLLVMGNFAHFGYGEPSYVVSGIITAIDAVLAILLVKRVRAYRVLILAFVAAVLSGAYAYFMK